METLIQKAAFFSRHTRMARIFLKKVLIAAKWLGVDFAGGASDIKDKLVRREKKKLCTHEKENSRGCRIGVGIAI